MILTIFADLITPSELINILRYIVVLKSTRGSRSVIENMKRCQDNVTRGLMADSAATWGKVLAKLPKPIRRLKSLRGFAKLTALQQVERIRLLLTICNIRKLFVNNWQVPLDPITEIREVNDETMVSEFAWFLENKCQKIISAIRTELAKIEGAPQKLHFVAKNGPNGDVRLTRHEDEQAVKRGNMLDRLASFCEMIGLPSPRMHFFDLKEEESTTSVIGRLSIKLEPGKVKNRVFAIFDGVSQEILRPVHDALMTVLKGLSEDCTYDQTKITRWVNSKAKFSFFGDSDLSQATDTIPNWIYKMILNQVKPGLGDAWYAVFDREFLIKESSNNRNSLNKTGFTLKGQPVQSGTLIKYGTGQGMGAYTSWALMALAHHLLLRFAAWKVGQSWGSKYLILGDDIVVASKAIFESYCLVLNGLNIPHKPTKSFGYCEFAKRQFYRGYEVSGVSLKKFNDRRFGQFWAQVSNLRSIGIPNVSLISRALEWTRSSSKARAAELIASFPLWKGSNQLFESEVGIFLNNRFGHHSTCNYYAREIGLVLAFKQLLVILLSQNFNSYARKMHDQLKEALRYIEEERMFSNHSSMRLENQYKMFITDVFTQSFTSVRGLERDFKMFYHKPRGLVELLRPDVPESTYDSLLSLADKRKLNQRLNFRVTELVRSLNAYESVMSRGWDND